MADSIIEHSEICQLVSKKLSMSAEQVDTVVRGYSTQIIDMMKEKKPSNHTDRLLIKTPIVCAEVTLDKEKIVTENGKKYNISSQYRVRYGIDKAILTALNEGLNVAKTIIEESKDKDKSKKAA